MILSYGDHRGEAVFSSFWLRALAFTKIPKHCLLHRWSFGRRIDWHKLVLIH